jgi:hypothetical protein
VLHIACRRNLLCAVHWTACRILAAEKEARLGVAFVLRAAIGAANYSVGVPVFGVYNVIAAAFISHLKAHTLSWTSTVLIVLFAKSIACIWDAADATALARTTDRGLDESRRAVCCVSTFN